MKQAYTLKDVRGAEINLEPVICQSCGSTETVYNQYVDALFCQGCGEVEQ